MADSRKWSSLTVAATSASVTTLTMLPGLGAAKSLHLGAEDELWEMVAFGESNGFNPASMLTGEEEACNEESMVSWALTLLLQSKKAQKASNSILIALG